MPHPEVTPGTEAERLQAVIALGRVAVAAMLDAMNRVDLQGVAEATAELEVWLAETREFGFDPPAQAGGSLFAKED